MRLITLVGFLSLSGCNSCTASMTCVDTHVEDTGDPAKDIVGTWHLTSEPGTDGKFLEFTADGKRHVREFSDAQLSETPRSYSGRYAVKGGLLIEDGEIIHQFAGVSNDVLTFRGEGFAAYRRVRCAAF